MSGREEGLRVERQDRGGPSKVADVKRVIVIEEVGDYPSLHARASWCIR